MKKLFYGGSIIPMTKANETVEAMLIQDQYICQTGRLETIKASHDDIDVFIDLKGRTLLPGFNDSHMHLLGFGESLKICKLENTHSIEELQEGLNAFSKQTSHQWIRGRGWNQDYFDTKEMPSASDLDAVVSDRPVVLNRACGHILVCNSKALEIAGITSDTPQPPGGTFDTDSSGNPTGILRENAMNLLLKHLPAPSKKDIEDAITAGGQYALSQGFTSVQSDDLCVHPLSLSQTILQILHDMGSQGRLPLRIDEQALFRTPENFKYFIEQGYKTGRASGFFKEGPLKILADGSLGARTAYLTKPYEDAPETCGIAMYTQQTLNDMVLIATEYGISTAIHAIGDRTIDMALDAFELARERYPRTQLRNSIVHCQITRPDQFDRMQALGVIAHIQPIFIQYDKNIVSDRLGHQRMKSTYAWHTMIDKGIPLAFGSDCPVEAMDIMPNLYSAVSRTDLSGSPQGGWMPEEKIDVFTALKGFTTGGAYASSEESLKGTLEAGKLADFVILDQNPLEVEHKALLDIAVCETWVDGTCAYKASI